MKFEFCTILPDESFDENIVEYIREQESKTIRLSDNVLNNFTAGNYGYSKNKNTTREQWEIERRDEKFIYVIVFLVSEENKKLLSFVKCQVGNSAVSTYPMWVVTGFRDMLFLVDFHLSDYDFSFSLKPFLLDCLKSVCSKFKCRTATIRIANRELHKEKFFTSMGFFLFERVFVGDPGINQFISSCNIRQMNISTLRDDPRYSTSLRRQIDKNSIFYLPLFSNIRRLIDYILKTSSPTSVLIFNNGIDGFAILNKSETGNTVHVSTLVFSDKVRTNMSSVKKYLKGIRSFCYKNYGIKHLIFGTIDMYMPTLISGMNISHQVFMKHFT